MMGAVEPSLKFPKQGEISTKNPGNAAFSVAEGRRFKDKDFFPSTRLAAWIGRAVWLPRRITLLTDSFR